MLNWGEFQILVGMNEKEKQKHSVKSEVQGQRILFFSKKRSDATTRSYLQYFGGKY